jgi:hypothetical protein
MNDKNIMEMYANDVYIRELKSYTIMEDFFEQKTNILLNRLEKLKKSWGNRSFYYNYIKYDHRLEIELINTHARLVFDKDGKLFQRYMFIWRDAWEISMLRDKVFFPERYFLVLLTKTRLSTDILKYIKDYIN